MWHEARKQEKKIREAVVDLQKRAERRRQHYAKQVGGRSHSHNDATQSFCSHTDCLYLSLQRRDPMQLMRVYGRKIPLHLNPAASKKSSNM